MASTAEKLQVLRTVALFAGASEEALSDMAARLSDEDLSAGEHLFKKGDPGTAMYIIASGCLRVYDRGVTLDRLGSGTILGEMAVIDNERRTASVVAEETSRLYRLDQAEFFGILSRHADIALAVMRVLSGRLRARAQELVEVRAELEALKKAHD